MPNKRVIFVILITLIGLAVFLKMLEAIEPAAQEGSQPANKVEYKAQELRDPFEEEKIETEAPVEEKPLPTLTVQGLIWGGNFPQAIINNKVVKVGDVIEGAQVINIAKEGVTLLFGARKYILSTVAPTNIKGPRDNPRGGRYE